MKRVPVFILSFLLLAATAQAGVTGSISGTVTDPSGGVVVGASVVALNVETGVKSSTQTNGQGFYSFPSLPIGRYSIQIQAQGFGEFEETNLILDVNTALRVDATLKMGTITEKILISATAAQVDTQSTQLGELVGGQEMVTVPLNGRDYTSLMALQPGVVPYSASDVGSGIGSYSAGTSEGTLSVSGGRPNSNGFMVNGGNTMEPMQNGTSVIPNLDSIAEFRILTNNFDAEYGHYSGGVVNVVTKSGTNEFHGDVFEFLRNTVLNARNYFNPASVGPKGKLIRNQFGGIFGGPIAKDRVFFFADYEGTRQISGGGNSTYAVPSLDDRQGILTDKADALTGTVNGPAVAQLLTQELGYPVAEGEPFYTSGCTSSTCVFPNAVIPQSAISPVATGLLPYIPKPNTAEGQFANSGSSSNSTFKDNKSGIRIDANTSWGMVSGYYHVDDYSTIIPDPITVGALGKTANRGRSQLFTIGDTKTFSNFTVNELRVSYMRNAAFSGAPAAPAVDPASVGFTVGCNTLGICPLSPFSTLPQIQMNNGITFGGPYGGNDLRINTYQVMDNFTRIFGTHSLKFGGIYSLTQANMQTSFANNSVFGFDGSAETGLDFADLLLGAPTNWQQGIQLPLYNRARYYGIFGQDSWRLARNLTLNYGLRWDVTTPWWEKYNHMEALAPGVQSASFPTAPVGWTIPGDGVPKTVAPIRYGNVAPRLGLAYSPDPKGGFWERLTGGTGKSSIRASWGMFYTDLEDYTNANGNGDAPYGLYWVSPTFPMFATPWVDLYTGNVEGQRFPVPPDTANASPSHPNPNVNWPQFMPISSSPTYYYKNVIPYTESYMLSLQRQFGAATVLTASYVGTQGHHLMVIMEANPANPALCLSVSEGHQFPGTTPCGPYSETGTFTTAAGQVIQVRQQLGPTGGSDFGSTGWFRTAGTSSYNSLAVTLRHTTGRLTLLGAYTYSKSMDNSSTATDQVYPFDPGRSKALSAFDLVHNFVVSYSYELPFDRAFGANRLTRGWIVSGITRFATGLPISTSETDDQSLVGATSVGPGTPLDEPNYTPGKLLINTNPRNRNPYFDNSLFTGEELGFFGNARRRFFHGPGTNNWDIALLKNLPITESKTLQFRAELFNAFNHAQFGNPDGNFNDTPDTSAKTGFGYINSAGDARVAQVAMKFIF